MVAINNIDIKPKTGNTHYKTVTNRVLIIYASIDYTLAIFDFHADLTNLTKNASLHSRLPSG